MKRKAKGEDDSSNEGDKPDKPKQQPPKKKQKPAPRPARVRLDAPLTHQELSRLDARGSSRPNWVRDEPVALAPSRGLVSAAPPPGYPVPHQGYARQHYPPH